MNELDGAVTIKAIVEQALQDGFLTPAMETEVGRICDSVTELSVEEYMALDRLMGALLAGEVVAIPRKQFINVMEELVMGEAVTRVAEIEEAKDIALDLGDVAAYALNRLPPLYATTEEGAAYQRDRALAELYPLIVEQVKEAIDRSLDRPQFFPERGAIAKHSLKGVVARIGDLLKIYAAQFEPRSQ